MNLNMLIREYNLTINNNNQKLFISVQTENDKNKISNVFIYFKLMFWLTIPVAIFKVKSIKSITIKTLKDSKIYHGNR